MASTDRRIEKALEARLKALLPPERAAAFVGGTHAERLVDNVVSTVSAEQLAALSHQVDGGSGGELKARTGSGKVPGHSPRSSMALALSSFGAWYGREQALTVGGIGGWTDALRLEAQLRILEAPRPANLDVLLTAPGRVLAVESKLREYVPPSKLPKALGDHYRKALYATLLPGGWARALTSILSGSEEFRHLDAPQLVKHALSIHSQFGAEKASERTLAYVYWEPANASELAECVAHREELVRFRALLGDDADPTFVPLTYAALWSEWDAIEEPWLPAHVAALRERYDLAV